MAQPNLCLDRLIVEVSRSHTVRHAHPLRLLWTSDQFVVEVAAYTIHSKYYRQTSMRSAGFELQVPAIERSQPYAFRPLNQWDWRSFILVSLTNIRGRITFGLLIKCCHASNSSPILWANSDIVIFGKVTQANNYVSSFKFSSCDSPREDATHPCGCPLNIVCPNRVNGECMRQFRALYFSFCYRQGLPYYLVSQLAII